MTKVRWVALGFVRGAIFVAVSACLLSLVLFGLRTGI
jgi:hypothetical protein